MHWANECGRHKRLTKKQRAGQNRDPFRLAMGNKSKFVCAGDVTLSKSTHTCPVHCPYYSI